MLLNKREFCYYVTYMSSWFRWHFCQSDFLLSCEFSQKSQGATATVDMKMDFKPLRLPASLGYLDGLQRVLCQVVW